MKADSKGLLVALALSAWSPLAGAQELIGCPVQQLDSEVVTRLPSEWWTTPVGGVLLGTEVRNVGGKAVLVCNYRGFGGSIPVTRELPAGVTSCVPGQGGFDCAAERVPLGGAPETPISGAVRGNAQIPTGNNVKLPPVSQGNARLPPVAPNTQPSTVTPVTQAQANAPTGTTSRPTAIINRTFNSGTRMGAFWTCEGNRCVRAPLVGAETEVEECRSLAQAAGRVLSFSTRERLLSAAALEDCNSPLVQQLEVIACSGADDLRSDSRFGMTWMVEGRFAYDSTSPNPLFDGEGIPANTCKTARVDGSILGGSGVPLARLERLNFRFRGGNRNGFAEEDDWDLAQLTVYAALREPGGRESSVRLVDERGTPFRRFENGGEYDIELRR